MDVSKRILTVFWWIYSIEVLAVFKRGKKLPKKPAKKGSGVRLKSAKSLRFTKSGKRLAHLNERLGNS